MGHLTALADTVDDAVQVVRASREEVSAARQ
jgi:hypothetical protein